MCVAIAQIANARSHFSTGEATDFFQAPVREAPAAGDDAGPGAASTSRRVRNCIQVVGDFGNIAAAVHRAPYSSAGKTSIDLKPADIVSKGDIAMVSSQGGAKAPILPARRAAGRLPDAAV